MSRKDGNTTRGRRRHHKAMKSGARGKGHDKKLRARKRDRSRSK